VSVRVQGSRSLAERAEATATENYAALEDEVIAVVRRKLSVRNMHLDLLDVQAAYCQAWQGVWLEIKGGGEVQSLMGMLVDITWKRSVDAYRGKHPAEHADADIEQQVVEVDIDEQLDDQARLRHFIARLRGRLNQRECEAVSLCLIHGYSRPEARELLGIKDEARMQKIMDGATKKIGPVVASITARGCGGEEWTRLLRAYALGTMTPEDRDYPRAEKHIAECAPCKRYVMGLRGLAVIVPPIGAPFMPASGHEGSILAHLRHLFAGHGTASAVGAGTGGAAAGGGGAGLLSSVGAGTAAKGVAVLAIVAVTAVVTVKPGHAVAKHHPPPRVAHIAQQTASAPSEPPVSPATESFTAAAAPGQGSSTTGRPHAASRRHHHGSARHGATKSLRLAPAPAPAAALGTSRASTPTASAASATNVPAVEKEFGPER
jgi:DNA-directed RNA polymerase specialized sigma24 family protein